MRVLLIAPACDGDDVGEAWFAYQWACHLGKSHDVTVLTYRKRGHRSAVPQLPDVRVIEWIEPPFLGRAERFNSLLKPAYFFFYFHARRWIRRARRREPHFDVIHQPVPLGMRYPSPGANLGIPFVLGPVGGSLDTPRGFLKEDDSAAWYTKLRRLDSFRLRLDPWLRRTYASADCVLGIGEYVRDFLMESGVVLKRFEVMSDTAVESVPSPRDRREESDSLNLLFVGRLVRTKGVREAISAMDLIRDLPVNLSIVGDGPDRMACEQLVESLGLREAVSFHGRRSRLEVYEHYREADVFVFPSYREPGGTVVHEAMSFGLPLIVVNRGGPSSSTNEDCAFRLPAVSPGLLAADVAVSIRRLAMDPDLRRRMGDSARKRAMASALWSSKIDAASKLYLEVVGV